jgi:cytochrome c biogenesis protein CcmG/thiol:disulfide interchange protein DsbE
MTTARRTGCALTIILGCTISAPIDLVSRPISAAVAATSSRKPAPLLSLRNAKGAPVKLSDYKGKVVLLDFWATWCTGCKLEIPWFMEFEKKYGAEGLTAIGVALDEDGWGTVKAYLAEHPITYPVVLGDMDILEKRFGLPASLPVTILIDRSGRIASTHAGVVDKDKFETDIRQLLAER